MMAVEGIGSLVQILANQLLGQTPNLQAGASARAAGNANNAAIGEDTFTPSNQINSAQVAARDAGIFQVGSGALTAVTASILFARANSSAAQSGAAAQNASAAARNAGNAQAAAAPTVNIPVTPGQLFGPTPAGQGPTAKAAPTTNIEAEIVALNAGLPALGLSKVEIQEIDSLATQLQNFNPATYTNLVNQFEALTQQPTHPSAPNPAPNASTAGSPNTKGNGSGSQT
jgi:hypothetical protein